MCILEQNQGLTYNRGFFSMFFLTSLLYFFLTVKVRSMFFLCICQSHTLLCYDTALKILMIAHLCWSYFINEVSAGALIAWFSELMGFTLAPTFPLTPLAACADMSFYNCLLLFNVLCRRPARTLSSCSGSLARGCKNWSGPALWRMSINKHPASAQPPITPAITHASREVWCMARHFHIRLFNAPGQFLSMRKYFSLQIAFLVTLSSFYKKKSL